MRQQLDCDIKQKKKLHCDIEDKKIGVHLEPYHHVVLKKHNELENLDFEHAGHIGFAGIKQGTWEGSTYIPLKDEIIAYLVEDHIKLKVGDGTTAVNDLPFVGDEISAEIEEEIRRAQEVELDLGTRITNEVNRAMAEEARLDGRIDNISTLGRYLSTWDASVGIPDTPCPESLLPYTYHGGDYFIISVPGDKIPTGTGIPGSGVVPYTTTTEELLVGYIYRYDGFIWSLLKVAQKIVTIDMVTGLREELNSKASAATVNTHISNLDIHVTLVEKQAWNAHITDTDVHVTTEDKTNWNEKADDNAVVHLTGDEDVGGSKKFTSAWTNFNSSINLYSTAGSVATIRMSGYDNGGIICTGSGSNTHTMLRGTSNEGVIGCYMFPSEWTTGIGYLNRELPNRAWGIATASERIKIKGKNSDNTYFLDYLANMRDLNAKQDVLTFATNIEVEALFDEE